MARETRVIQIHPDNESYWIEYYERFGWEVISNQRCQERKIKNGEWYLSTFNKITFSRDKSAPWYQRAVILEEEYNALISDDFTHEELKQRFNYSYKILQDTKEKPKVRKLSKFLVPFVIGIGCFVAYFISEIVYMLPIGLIFLIASLVNVRFVFGLSGEEGKKAIKEYKEYQQRIADNKAKIEEFIGGRMIDIEEELEELIK